MDLNFWILMTDIGLSAAIVLFVLIILAGGIEYLYGNIDIRKEEKWQGL